MLRLADGLLWLIGLAPGSRVAVSQAVLLVVHVCVIALDIVRSDVEGDILNGGIMPLTTALYMFTFVLESMLSHRRALVRALQERCLPGQEAQAALRDDLEVVARVLVGAWAALGNLFFVSQDGMPTWLAVLGPLAFSVYFLSLQALILGCYLVARMMWGAARNLRSQMLQAFEAQDEAGIMASLDRMNELRAVVVEHDQQFAAFWTFGITGLSIGGILFISWGFTNQVSFAPVWALFLLAFMMGMMSLLAMVTRELRKILVTVARSDNPSVEAARLKHADLFVAATQHSHEVDVLHLYGVPIQFSLVIRVAYLVLSVASLLFL